MSRKLTLEIFEAVLATAVSTTKDTAQLIFIFESCQPLGLYYKNLPLKKPSRVSLDDVIPPKMSYSPLQKFRPHTGMEITPNRDFNR